MTKYDNSLKKIRVWQVVAIIVGAIALLAISWNKTVSIIGIAVSLCCLVVLWLWKCMMDSKIAFEAAKHTLDLFDRSADTTKTFEGEPYEIDAVRIAITKRASSAYSIKVSDKKMLIIEKS